MERHIHAHKHTHIPTNANAYLPFAFYAFQINHRIVIHIGKGRYLGLHGKIRFFFSHCKECTMLFVMGKCVLRNFPEMYSTNKCVVCTRLLIFLFICIIIITNVEWANVTIAPLICRLYNIHFNTFTFYIYHRHEHTEADLAQTLHSILFDVQFWFSFLLFCLYSIHHTHTHTHMTTQQQRYNVNYIRIFLERLRDNQKHLCSLYDDDGFFFFRFTKTTAYHQSVNEYVRRTHTT